MNNMISKIIAMGILISCSHQLFGQKTKEKINERADKVSNRALDNLEETVFSAKIKFPSKQKAKDTQKSKQEERGVSWEEELHPMEELGRADGTVAFNGGDLKSYSNYDFIMGTTILFADNFDKASLGGIPDGWNTSSNLEVVELSLYDGKWLKMGKGQTNFTPLTLGKLPDSFTLEFDLVLDVDGQKFAPGTRMFGVILNDLQDASMKLGNRRGGDHWIFFGFSGDRKQVEKRWKKSEYNEFNATPLPILSKTNLNRGDKIRVSMWKSKNRIRFYINEEKVYDIIQAQSEESPFRSLKFFSDQANDGEYLYMSNIRIGDAPPVIKSDLENKGVFEATGIYFESGSAVIKPESFPSLKQIADFMNQHGGSFSIAGHTDNVGNSETNRLLSEQRASAVRNVLIKEFGVSTNQLASRGYGLRYPIYPNDTKEGRAKNRRVDIINLDVVPNYEERLAEAIGTIQN
ncbi:OmpA family protein [Belliella sp. R4-6]|uniref:OmpA family protein n=1 Tax=Belliella alkalica TaxID=1730871 RepID=A0ABS9V7U3_9BACT|nr:OmpA family protein [Belliella alkalica]MCH7412438.1 OmpA family protein [Belliella alkalica]